MQFPDFCVVKHLKQAPNVPVKFSISAIECSEPEVCYGEGKNIPIFSKKFTCYYGLQMIKVSHVSYATQQDKNNRL